MKFGGQILKMMTQNAQPVQYFLNLSGDLLQMNQLIGKKIGFRHIGYECVNCGSDEKIFRMGFCKRCFFESPFASDTIIRPELSKAHLGIAERDLAVEEAIQLQPHIVYLAYTGDVKVGVTRASQVPTRWIDQGATAALCIAKTENRYQAGMIEVALKDHIADKTNWRKMLEDKQDGDVDLLRCRDEIKEYFPEEFVEFFAPDEEVMFLNFPYHAPDKISSFTLDKNPEFEGVLNGIKGQYLSFEGGDVMNIRGHEGYVVELEVAANLN